MQVILQLLDSYIRSSQILDMKIIPPEIICGKYKYKNINACKIQEFKTKSATCNKYTTDSMKLSQPFACKYNNFTD